MQQWLSVDSGTWPPGLKSSNFFCFHLCSIWVQKTMCPKSWLHSWDNANVFSFDHPSQTSEHLIRLFCLTNEGLSSSFGFGNGALSCEEFRPRRSSWYILLQSLPNKVAYSRESMKWINACILGFTSLCQVFFFLIQAICCWENSIRIWGSLGAKKRDDSPFKAYN